MHPHFSATTRLPNVRPPKVKYASPFLRDYSTTPGGELESCTFEVRQYSAYRFRQPPTPGMRLVQFKHDQQGQQRYGPQPTRTGLRHPGTLSCCHTYISSSFPRPVSNFYSFFLSKTFIPRWITHIWKHKTILYLASNQNLLDFYRTLSSIASLSSYTY